MHRKVIWIVSTAVFCLVGVSQRATADVRRETTERRPYVVEIGEPYAISPPTLQQQAQYISALQEYLDDYGAPDYAEVQEILPDWPWDSYEVRLYYLRRNLEVDFGHVFVLHSMPSLGVEKFRGTISDEKRQQVELALATPVAPAVAPPPPAPESEVEAAPPADPMEAIVTRIEAAADRAAQAADRAVASSEAAVRAADRSTAIIEKLQAEPAASKPRGH